MGYLVTGKSDFFQTPLLLGTMEKTAPGSLEHQSCQRKSLVPVEESFYTRHTLRVFYVWLRNLRVKSIT